MFDGTGAISGIDSPATGRQVDTSAPWRGLADAYQGPERRSTASQATRWLAQMLDEIDYGLVLLLDASHVLHINRAARADLDARHPLQLAGRELRARHGHDAVHLHEALAGARRGLRKLLSLGDADGGVSVAVVPLGPLTLGGPHATLLLLGKRSVCERLSVQMFARAHALTPAETRVLEALCQGLDPREVARHHGVGLATIRTQIGAIRAKTDTVSIRDLLGKVAVLPPVVGVVSAPRAGPCPSRPLWGSGKVAEPRLPERA